MTQAIRDAVFQFMKREACQGHFEHTVEEIRKGINESSRRVVEMMLVELKSEKKWIDARERGGGARYFYLVELREMCNRKWPISKVIRERR